MPGLALAAQIEAQRDVARERQALFDYHRAGVGALAEERAELLSVDMHPPRARGIEA